MRVTGGSVKGRRLRATRAASMRPTTDTARRTMFDILGARPRGAVVLDLFAGAGTLGIEALSRGAREATFVEKDREACGIIARNLDLAGFSGVGLIKRADVVRFLSGTPETAFDLVFLDPPYGRGLPFVARVLQALLQGEWVRPGGTVVVEAETGPLSVPPGLSEIRTRRFGRTQLVVTERDAATDSDLPGDV